jgi:hypothetical protein
LRVVGRICSAAACCLMKVTAGSGAMSKVVDLYNSVSGTWSTAQLSVARWRLEATSVGNVAIFAGGQDGNSSFACCVEGLLLALLFLGDDCLRRVSCCCLSLRSSSKPSHQIQYR